MNTIFSDAGRASVVSWVSWIKRAKAGLAIASLFGMHCAYAAPVKLTATINPGTACTANLSDAELAYGTILASQLNRDKPTVLPSKPLTLNVACAPLASKFYFTVIDRNMNPTALPGDLAEAAGVPAADRFNGMGLGLTQDGRALGELFLKSTTILADTQNKILLQKLSSTLEDSGGNWAVRRSDFLWGDHSGWRRYQSADPASQVAGPVKNFTVQMQAIPVISPLAIDGLSADAQLNGKFTIEITQI